MASLCFSLPLLFSPPASSRRAGLFAAALFSSLLSLLCPQPGLGQDQDQAAQSSRLPNVVFILVDDLGYKDLSCYGSTFYETPAIDALAESGMKFTQAYTAAPVCSPSRASILTGRNPARTGFTGHITAILEYRHPKGSRYLPPRDHMKLRLEEQTLAELLKPAGYFTANIGKWHLGDKGFWPEDQGFDVNIGGDTHGSPPTYFDPYENPKRSWSPDIENLPDRKPGEYLTDRLTDEAVSFIRENREKPFFLYLSHYAVHTPIEAKPELVPRYEEKLKTDRSQKNAKYAAMIESVDQSTARVMEALKSNGIEDNTLVIFFSDNGGLSDVTNNAPLREGKQWLYEGGIRVPLIVRWPGHTKPGRVSGVPVHSDDLFPTIAEVTGQTSRIENPLDGKSLAPLLKGEEDPESLKDRTFYFYYPHYAKRPGYIVREGDYKLIVHYDPPKEELFNLAEDLSEEKNLADRMPERVQQMKAGFEEWLESVGAVRHTPNPEWKGGK